jgi:Peptidase family M50
LLLRAAADPYAADVATAFARLGIDDLERGDVAVARAHLDLALAFLDAGYPADEGEASAMRQARVVPLTNRGVALLRLAQKDPNHPPICDRNDDDDLCRAAAADFTAALAIDPLNAVISMNRAWADRAMGRPLAAREALETAVGADPSLYPAANDVGVLAARSGDDTAARQAFRSALSTRPDYALAWWNLGVLDLRSGLSHFRTGHAALAEATRLDPSLSGSRLDYRTDEAVYRITFDSVEEVSSEWAVGRTYGVAAAVLGGIGMLTALGRFSKTVIANVWDSLLSLVRMEPESRPAWLTRLATRLSTPITRLRRMVPPRVRSYLPWIVTCGALVAISAWTVWRTEADSAMAVLIGVTIATTSALAAHESGHLLAMRRWGGRLIPAQWTGGVLLALLLVPVGASSGPYFAERIDDAESERLVRIHAAGPAANLALSAAAYVAYLVHPVSVLLLTSQISVAVGAYTLLPNVPLDGRALKEHPVAATVLGLAVVSAGVAFATNLT